MGYYTDYELTVSDNSLIDTIAAEMSEFTDYKWNSSLALYDVKWYNWQSDIREISSRYPNVLFTLDGAGEESADIWRVYAKNGKIQLEKAKITFEQFNEEKLK